MGVKRTLAVLLFLIFIDKSAKAQEIIGEYYHTLLGGESSYEFSFNSDSTFRLVYSTNLNQKYISQGIYRIKKDSLFLFYQEVIEEQKSMLQKKKLSAFQQSEELEVEFQVYDQDSILMHNMPIISIEDKDQARSVRSTDNDGKFKLRLDKKSNPIVSIKVGLLGYEMIEFPCHDFEGASWLIEIYLAHKTQYY